MAGKYTKMEDTPGDSSDDEGSGSYQNPTHQEGVPGDLVPTLKKPSRVEKELEAASNTPSKWLTILKWVVSILLSLSFTFCLVCGKIGILFLGHYLNETHPRLPNAPPTSAPTSSLALRSAPVISTPPIGALLNSTITSAPQTHAPVDEKPAPPETTLAMILIVVTLPAVITFLRTLWYGGFNNDQPWPSTRAFLVGFLSSILESLGLSMFVICVLPIIPPSEGVFLMNGVFLMPAAYMLFQSLRSRAALRYYLTVPLLFCVLLSVAGIILSIPCVPCPEGHILEPAVWAIPVSLICLNLAWCNPLQRLQLSPRITENYKSKVSLVTHRELKVGGDGTLHIQVTPGTSTADTNHIDLETIMATYPALTARWKNSIIQSFLKILIIPAFCVFFTHSFHGQIDLSKLHDGFAQISPDNNQFPFFISAILYSFVGYLLGWLACRMSMERLAFALPLSIATPIAFILVLWLESCDIDILVWSTYTTSCSLKLTNKDFVIPSAICLYIAQLLLTGCYLLQGKGIVMDRESQLFWLPGYNGLFLEQHLFLSRKTTHTKITREDRLNKVKNSRVFICTTMYREAEHEMRELLRSLGRINKAKILSDRHIQAHIFFDNGVRYENLTQFALQLVDMAIETLGLRLENCKKMKTPYGLQLKWTLPTETESQVNGMEFVIHLKDNIKVKNKKRWSQIMYMTYVLDYVLGENNGSTSEASDDNTFILTTDGDVAFTPASVGALLDLISHDALVGAACARTYPRGSGPVAWYQVFEYAIGHWFQKATNDVLGTVLCCPGAFSVYRAGAVRDVLKTYASGVTRASEFLTKDMGEDRWLCTLLVQSGWCLRYNPAAECYTYCPEEFDEFFTQRRRWVSSMMANLALLLKDWNKVYHFNKSISLLFLFYQATLLFLTMVSPAVCILVITGAVTYTAPSVGLQAEPIPFTIFQYVLIIGFMVLLFCTSPNNQLKEAKLLTVYFVLLMFVVTLLSVYQLALDIVKNMDYSVNQIFMDDIPLTVSMTTIYFASIITMVIAAALLHLPEVYYLLHGVWYLWCLPVGVILLLPYSLVNLTDPSWGTRDEKTGPHTSVLATAGVLIKRFFGSMYSSITECFRKCGKKDKKDKKKDPESKEGENPSGGDKDEGDDDLVEEPPLLPEEDDTKIKDPTTVRKGDGPSEGHPSTSSSTRGPIKVSDWLKGDLKEEYAYLLENAGYEDTTFLVGLTDQDLKDVGVKVNAHRKALLKDIATLADPEIPESVPENPEEWIRLIGLEMYADNFEKFIRGKDMGILKWMSREDIEKDLGIKKQGHLKRVLLAIKMLRIPTESEKRQAIVKAELEHLNTGELDEEEGLFWEDLRVTSLLPSSPPPSNDDQLKAKLTVLRNSSVILFVIINTLWILLILLLALKSKFDGPVTNVISLILAAIFGFVITVQFLCMIIHRLGTFITILARTPYRWGEPYHTNWSWRDADFRKENLDSQNNAQENIRGAV